LRAQWWHTAIVEVDDEVVVLAHDDEIRDNIVNGFHMVAVSRFWIQSANDIESLLEHVLGDVQLLHDASEVLFC
jgi:hypothetical protein